MAARPFVCCRAILSPIAHTGTPPSFLAPRQVAADNPSSPAVLFFPCSGNGNGTSWNNRTSNGYFWSASFNSARNARNLLFGPTGVDPQNTGYRCYGFAVRAVQ